MPTAWFICPYDLEVRMHPNSEGQLVPRSTRVPAMYRHIPNENNKVTENWSEVEILGGEMLVKVMAPAPLMATIATDPDFLEIPNPVPLAKRPSITSKLLDLGYTVPQIAQTGWDVPTLLEMLAGERNEVQRGPNWTIVVLPSRIPVAKTIAQIHRHIP